jgi:hypothetical protein
MHTQPEKQLNPMAAIDRMIDAAAPRHQLVAATRATLEREARCAVLFQRGDQ